MAVVIDEIHDEENPNTEGGEALPETCAIIQLWGKSQLTAGGGEGHTYSVSLGCDDFLEGFVSFSFHSWKPKNPTW